MEHPALEAPVLALAHDPLHVLLENFQVAEQNPLERAAACRIVRHLPHLPQRQRYVARENLLAEGSRPAKEPVGQLFNVPYAQSFAAHRHHELLDLLLLDAVHAHELAQGVHIGVDRERAAEELLTHLGAHRAQQAQPHGHPGLADRQFRGDLRHVQVAHVFEFVDETGLLENAQAFVLGRAQQPQNPHHLVGAEGGVRHGGQAQPAGTAIPLESVEQNLGLWHLDAFQGFLDPALGNRRQKPGFGRRRFEAVVFVPQVQLGQFNLVRHAGCLSRRMFIEPGHSVIDPAPPAHARLSQNLRQQLQDLLPADFPALDPTDDHPHMLHDRLRPRSAAAQGRGVLGVARRRGGGAAASSRAALVQIPFLFSPFLGPVVVGTATRGLLTPVGLTAAKGTTQVLAPRIARISEKKDAAVPASGQAPSPVRLASQHRSHELVILQDQLPDLRPAIPVPRKLKMLRDRYCKKPKLSLKILTLESMSSSYRIATSVSRRWDGDFYGSDRVERPRSCPPWERRTPLALSRWLSLSQQTRLNLAERYRKMCAPSPSSFSHAEDSRHRLCAGDPGTAKGRL